MSNQFNSVPPVTSHAKHLRENRNGRNEGQIVASKGTATATAGAATLHALAGVVTSESITTAAGATYTLTLTNSLINAGSVINANADKASSAGMPVVTSVTAGSGSATIIVQNVHASAAFNNAIKIHFNIIQ